MRLSLLAAAAVLAVGTLPAVGTAATATGQFQVLLTINAECQLVSASDLDFGTTGVIQTGVAATSNIVVQCTKTTPYQIGLDAGLGAGATVASRKMTGGTETVDYTMYQDSGRTSVWGNTLGSDTVASTGTGAQQTFTVYGYVPPQTTPPPGSYLDTVQVTVTY